MFGKRGFKVFGLQKFLKNYYKNYKINCGTESGRNKCLK